MISRLALLAVVALATLGCSDQLVIEDASEIAAHREFASPIIRGVDACVDEISRDQRVGYGAFAHVSLHVDRTGRARITEILGLSGENFWNAETAACRQQVEAQMATWRYRPFERNGRAISAKIAERVLMLPAERWRSSGRPFPQISNPNAVVITLVRRPALYFCRGDRSPAYTLQIRGDGRVTISGQSVDWGAGHAPRLIDAPTRTFTISPAAVERLIEQFRAASFFSLEDEYESGITDQQAQFLTFEAGAERASVRDYVGETVGMPLVVRDLQNAVDATAGLLPLRCGPETTLRMTETN